jgi:5-methyltetrahydrofolate--homocysteine methyltransferase
VPTDRRSGYLDLLAERVVIFDGATGTNLQLRELGPDDFGGPELEGCNEVLVATRPDVVAELHASFLDVGVDVIETDTFGAFATVLGEYGIAHRAEELGRTAARIARRTADDFSVPGRPRLVAGSIGPGTKFPSLGQIAFGELRDAYEALARGLIDGGVDLLCIETCFDPLQAKAAMLACRRAMAHTSTALPVQVQVTIELTGRMLPGTEIGAVLAALEPLHPDVIGLNCATGPAEMGEPLRYLCEHSELPISCQPNAGLPSVVDGQMHYDLDPDGLARYLSSFVTELGVSVIGGCCGTTPAHLAAVVEACSGLVPAPRRAMHEPGASSLYSFVPFAQDQSVLLIGERTNANGSKRFREAMLAGDLESVTAVAREQIREGAHLLDVCVDYTGADGVADIRAVLGRLATESTIPIVIDSTEPAVIEAGLQLLGGRAVINSVNLEDGEGPDTRLHRVLSLASHYGAAVICTCIDQEGQARTAAWKLRAAKALFELATKRYKLLAEDLFFDPLALPLSTGMQESRGDGIATLEAISMIKAELPGTHTVLGLSNISFGLSSAARVVLNSVFLHEAAGRGLDAAIVHAGKLLSLHRIGDEERQICLDLIYDRRRAGYDPLSELIERFQGVRAAASAAADFSDWPLERRLAQRIVDANRDGLEDDLTEALGAGITALAIVNDLLLPGMQEVGELFASGAMQLPFVLASAETMKAAVAFLEPFMERNADRGSRGTVVLATVRGDVHDIGKNLVDIILSNNGYDVRNLGIKVGIAEMLAEVESSRADALGMSGLLVKSTLVMRENLEEINRRRLSALPVLLGGAALTRSYVERDLRSCYDGPVFYGKDAFEGLRVLNRLGEIRSGTVSDPDFGRTITERTTGPRRSEQLSKVDLSTLAPRGEGVESDNVVFKPPFLGLRHVAGISLSEIAPYLNETALFRNQWGFRPTKGETDEAFKQRVRAELRARLDAARADDVLVPKVAYGFFAVNADGQDLVVFSDDERRTELVRFVFPRQRVAPYLCIADFFRSVASGEPDYAAFHIATMGARVSEHAAALFAADRYRDYLFLHGLGVEMTEALAELWHHRIRQQWGFAHEDGPSLQGLFRQQYRGGRYSWGYPACPDLEENAKVASLLESGRIGVTVSEGFQLHPEQTTSAIICHHPKAKYFVV